MEIIVSYSPTFQLLEYIFLLEMCPDHIIYLYVRIIPGQHCTAMGHNFSQKVDSSFC